MCMILLVKIFVYFHHFESNDSQFNYIFRDVCILLILFFHLSRLESVPILFLSRLLGENCSKIRYNRYNTIQTQTSGKFWQRDLGWPRIDMCSPKTWDGGEVTSVPNNIAVSSLLRIFILKFSCLWFTKMSDAPGMWWPVTRVTYGSGQYQTIAARNKRQALIFHIWMPLMFWQECLHT